MSDYIERLQSVKELKKKNASFEIYEATSDRFNEYVKSMKAQGIKVRKGDLMDEIINDYLDENEDNEITIIENEEE